MRVPYSAQPITNNARFLIAFPARSILICIQTHHRLHTQHKYARRQPGTRDSGTPSQHSGTQPFTTSAPGRTQPYWLSIALAVIPHPHSPPITIHPCSVEPTPQLLDFQHPPHWDVPANLPPFSWSHSPHRTLLNYGWGSHFMSNLLGWWELLFYSLKRCIYDGL